MHHNEPTPGMVLAERWHEVRQGFICNMAAAGTYRAVHLAVHPPINCHPGARMTRTTTTLTIWMHQKSTDGVGATGSCASTTSARASLLREHSAQLRALGNLPRGTVSLHANLNWRTPKHRQFGASRRIGSVCAHAVPASAGTHNLANATHNGPSTARSQLQLARSN